jgi:class 3 adenylate cyclase/tetratricopeptide (TPR) repeat protein
MEGERKQVTVLFCDIAGSTALAQRVGAETMHGLLNRFFDTALVEVHRYEGTLNQFLGDGFMALFGAPIAHEDHARRAAHAALAIRRACHAQTADPAAGRMPLRLGLNTGPVVVGNIGDNLRMDYTAIGDTTNLAARMQQMAAPGEILLAGPTWEAIRLHFECEALGERRVKGKAHGVPVYRLHDARSSHPPGDSSVAPATTTPLVGRERELSALRESVGRLHSGRGGIVGVIGEAGLGKSRLLLEVKRLEGANLCWLEGHALSFGQNLSYSPFMDALRGVANVDEREGRDASWARLESFLREHLGEQAAALLPFAGMLLGLELPAMANALVARLDPQDVRGQIFITARRIFEALARARPVVLELEDWQWADESSSGLLDHLLPLTETEPLLVCFAGRADAGTACARVRETAAQRYPQHYVEMLLGPLSSSDSNRMMENLVGSEHLPPALRGVILRKAEGNPLFIEEVVRSLHGGGALQRDLVTGALRVAGEADGIELPDTIEAIIMARIDRLETDVKQVLRLAAVIGRSFYRRILQALDEADHQLDQCLNQLQQFELIRQRRLEPEVEYMFKHALVHEASYRSILEERRRELHRRVADAIEGLFADRLDELGGLLAYHYARAAEWKKAQRYLLRAGDQAARMSADVEALAHYRAAMESYARAFGERWDRFERASLERKIGEALFRLGQPEPACRHLYTALSLLGNRYPRTRAGVLVHIVGHVLQQLWHQMRPRRYRRREEERSAADTDRVRAWVSLGWLDYFRDEERFLLDVLAGLNWAERRAIGTAAAQGLMGLGVACDVMRLSSLAGYYHSRAQSVAGALDDALAKASAEFGMAYHRMMVGEWDSAVAEMERAMHAFRAQGKLREHGVSAGTLVWLLQLRGEVAKARRFTEEFAGLADAAGDMQTSIYAVTHRAWFLMQEGHLQEAAAGMERGIEALKGFPDYQILCEILGERVCCALWMGDLRRAETWIEEGRRVMRQHTIAPQLTATLRAGNGWLALTLLELAATDEKVVALRRARKAVSVLHRLDPSFAGAVPVALCIEGCVEWMCGRPGRAEAAWNRSLQTADAIGFGYQLAVTHQQMGRLTRGVSHLKSALALFDESGFTFLAARTLRYLGETYAGSDPEAATDCLRRSLALHESMSAPYELQLTRQRYSDILEPQRAGT